MMKSLAMTIVSLLLLTQPSAQLLARQQQQQSTSGRQDWAAIEMLAADSKVRVETKDGGRVEGKFNSVSDAALTLTRKGKAVSLSRLDVSRVYRLEGGWSRTTSALVGTGVGGGIGGGLMAGTLAATGGSDAGTRFLALSTVVGAGIGAAVGAVLGGRGKRVLIYEAQQ